MSPTDKTGATVLLHQFSEWLDDATIPYGASHDDVVTLFLEQRHPDATPALVDIDPEPQTPV